MKMTANRNSSRNIHDRVVRAIARKLNHERFDVIINPGDESNETFEGVYPGVIIVRRSSETLEAVMEVKTEETLGQPQTRDLWARCCARRIPLYLIVPTGKEEAARTLIHDWRPMPLLGTFKLGPDDHVDVRFMA